MSARKAVHSGSLSNLTIEGREARLVLSPNSIIIHKSGIEFRSSTPFAPWKEMTLTLQSPGDEGRVHCSGVVIGCSGNKHTGYHVSMVLTGMSKQAEARLGAMARAQI